MVVETRAQRARQRPPSSPAQLSNTGGSPVQSSSSLVKKAPKTHQPDGSPNRNTSLRSVRPSNVYVASSKRKRIKDGSESDGEDEQSGNPRAGTRRVTNTRPVRALKRRKLSTPDLLATKFAARPSASRGQATLQKRKASEEERDYDAPEPAEKRARISQSENDGILSPGFRGLPHNLSPIHESHTTHEAQHEHPLGPLECQDSKAEASLQETDIVTSGSTYILGSSGDAQATREPDSSLGSNTLVSGQKDSTDLPPGTPTEPDHLRSPSPVGWGQISRGALSLDGPSMLEPTSLLQARQPPPPARFFTSISTLSQSTGLSIVDQPSFNEFTSSQTERVLRAPPMKDLDFFSQVTSDAAESQPPIFESFSPPPVPSPPSDSPSPLPGSPGSGSQPIMSNIADRKVMALSRLTGPSPFSNMAGASAFSKLAEASTSAAAKPSLFETSGADSGYKGLGSRSPLRAAPSFATTFTEFATTIGQNKRPPSSPRCDEGSPPDSQNEEENTPCSQNAPLVSHSAQGDDERPFIKLEKAEILTGEENEVILSQAQGKLFMFAPSDSSWVNRGQGIIKLKAKESDGTACRLLMRQGTRVILNLALHPQMGFKPMGDGPSRAFTAPDLLTEGHPLQQFAIQLVGNNISSSFFDKLDECISHTSA